MPRANRFVLPGYIYHLTHRCHDKKFLLKFAKDRDGYRRRLRDAVVKHRLSLLSYNITCNHVHLIVCADAPEQVASVMQSAAGELARDYNRRKSRTGAFWEGRYHATIVDSGEYLWECLKYVELNMVRCGVVDHPREWEWSGYNELMGQRRRNRLLDIDRLLELLSHPDCETFQRNLDHTLTEMIARDCVRQEPKWTGSLAVGSNDFVTRLEPMIRNRQRTETIAEDEVWVLKEAPESYGAFLAAEKRPIQSSEHSNLT